MASLKKPERSFFIYDVFEVIPPPTTEDTTDVHARYSDIANGSAQGIGGDAYYGYLKNLYDVVIQNFNDFGINPASSGVSLIKGDIRDTLSIQGPVALAHIDVDWYQPVITCLDNIFPRLSVGGTIILDDYHSWGGCRKAADEYLTKIEGQFHSEHYDGALSITRIKTNEDALMRLPCSPLKRLLPNDICRLRHLLRLLELRRRDHHGCRRLGSPGTVPNAAQSRLPHALSTQSQGRAAYQEVAGRVRGRHKPPQFDHKLLAGQESMGRGLY
jgi:asparagine synthase (glutamine-hydrolysing)